MIDTDTEENLPQVTHQETPWPDQNSSNLPLLKLTSWTLLVHGPRGGMRMSKSLLSASNRQAGELLPVQSEHSVRAQTDGGNGGVEHGAVQVGHDTLGEATSVIHILLLLHLLQLLRTIQSLPNPLLYRQC